MASISLFSRGLCYGKQKFQVDPACMQIFRASEMTTPSGRPKGFDRKTKQGFSDHVPITGSIRTV